MSESSLIKLQAPISNFIKEIPTQVISREIYEIFKSTLFYRASPVAASEGFRFPACNFIKKENPE